MSFLLLSLFLSTVWVPDEGIWLWLQAGSEVNAQTADGLTALHLAARDGRVQVTGALLAAGADVMLEDSQGCTAVLYAARVGDMALFQALYRQSGEAARKQDAQGWTSSHLYFLTAYFYACLASCLLEVMWPCCQANACHGASWLQLCAT